jgi:predicted Zn-dependent protease
VKRNSASSLPRTKSLVLSSLLALLWPLSAQATLVRGQDYYALQIASGDPAALASLFPRYAKLPFVRIEKRDNLHVLRAGFWPTQAEARKAQGAQALTQGSMLRVATFRPEQIVKANWSLTENPPTPAQESASGAVPAVPVAIVDTPPPTRSAPSVEEPPAAAPAPPVEQDDLTLAFNAFMAAGHLPQALRVATKALVTSPDSAEWRRRAARLAEWSQRPLVAWEHWRVLLAAGMNDDEVLFAILRLAPLADGQTQAITVWRALAARKPLTPAQSNDLFELYRIAGRQQEGSPVFERFYRQRKEVRLLEQAAQLAEEAGEGERAYTLFAERAALPPFSPDATLRAAAFLIRRDRLKEALAVLQSPREQVPAEQTAYWRMLAQVAWEASDTKVAEHAYQQLSQGKQSTSADWARLIYLARERSTGAAATLAEGAFYRFGEVTTLVLALNLYRDVGDTRAEQRLHQNLSAEQRAEAEKSTAFLLARALWHQSQHRLDAAWSDLTAALAKAPGDAGVEVPALWLAIDTGRTAELRQMLENLSTREGISNANEYWLAIAASWQRLDAAPRSLPWYRLALARTPNDPLLLLSYADALNLARQPGLATRIRRHAWLLLDGSNRRLTSADLGNLAGMDSDNLAHLLAATRLMLIDTPHDPGLEKVRILEPQLRGIALPEENIKGPANVRAAGDLVLAWLLSREQFPAARQWMWRRWARTQQSEPGWARSQLALSEENTPEMAAVLGDRTAAMDPSVRYDLAYGLEMWPSAMDTAFDALGADQGNEEIHDRFRIGSPLHANYLQLSLYRNEWGTLDGQGPALETRLNVTPELALTLMTASSSQQLNDGSNDLLVPGSDKLASAELLWQGNLSQSRFAVFKRNELSSTTGARFAHEHRLTQRLTVNGELGWRNEATDSLAMRVAGMADSLQLGMQYTLSKREYLRAGVRTSRFATQYGDPLGSGWGVDFEVGHRIRTEYPDWALRLTASRQTTSPNAKVSPAVLARLSPAIQLAIAGGEFDVGSFFLPEGSSTWGLCSTYGENIAGQALRSSYSRDWRPFGDLCWTRNSINGGGHSGVLGFAGSVIGADHLSLNFEQSQGGSGNGARTRNLALRYRFYF